MTRLSAVEPFPEPKTLPDAYDRYALDVETQRDVLTELVAGTDWAASAWPRLVDDLIALGRTDVPLSRLAEGHVDALRILAQAGSEPVAGASYGVWASRSAQTGLAADVDEDTIRIAGTLRFASGAGLIDRSLVPVWTASGRHVLVDLDVTGLEVDASVWRTAAMQQSRTYEVHVRDLVVPRSAQVGPDDFYLTRPGFFAGGVGVAACWVGGAARVFDVLAAFHPKPSPAQQGRFGQIRTELVAAAATVRAAARVLEDHPDVDTGPIALETRAVVADAVHRVLATARLLTGPTGLALDDGIAHAIPDLELYVLQHNSDSARIALGDPAGRP